MVNLDIQLAMLLIKKKSCTTRIVGLFYTNYDNFLSFILHQRRMPFVSSYEIFTMNGGTSCYVS